MGKRKKRTTAISRGGIRRALPPYARAMRFADRPLISKPTGWILQADGSVPAVPLRTKSAAPECDQHPETAKGGDSATSSASSLPVNEEEIKK